MTFTLLSPAFQSGTSLPEKFTCRGAGLMPPLAWNSVPDGTASFCLILEDPDAPGGMFRHYGVYNLAGSMRDIAEGRGELAAPAAPVLHDFGKTGLFPPCPPPGSGTHHYRFRLFAMPVERLEFESPPTCQGLIAMMTIFGPPLGEAVLTATCVG